MQPRSEEKKEKEKERTKPKRQERKLREERKGGHREKVESWRMKQNGEKEENLGTANTVLETAPKFYTV